MSGQSAYEVLGLDPGAEPAAIDLAYRQLIKRYHPDREGGDAARAAEINRAYYELRKPATPVAERSSSVDLGEALFERSRSRSHYVKPRRRRPAVWPFLFLAIVVVGFVKREQVAVLADELRADAADLIQPGSADGATGSAVPAEIDGPLNRAAIIDSAKLAKSLRRSGGLDALVEESRSCLQRLRSEPSLELLDRCAAFDDAVIEIENGGSVYASGPFGAPAVTARQMAAAKLLSDDYNGIESRLDRVRTLVQMSLAPPPEPPPPPPSGVSEPASGATSSLPPLVSGSDGPAPH